MTRQEILAVARPILFNTEMVRAVLEGRKTMTRRAIKPQPEASQDGMCHWKDCQWMDPGLGFPISSIQDYAPFQPGDYLYVRETWAKLDSHYFYKAAHELLVDGEPLIKVWKPSIHMPKEAAQLFLRVTGVGAERLQEISPHNAKNEGIKFRPFNGNYPHFKEWLIKDFRNLWDSTIKKADLPIYGWEANPWVWVIEFQKVEANRNG